MEWAILILIIGSVMAAELFNTSVEYAVDTATMEYNEYAKRAKDVAAAAPMIACAGAIIAGIFLFGQPNRLFQTGIMMFTEFAPVTILLLTAQILFVIFFKNKNNTGQ